MWRAPHCVARTPGDSYPVGGDYAKCGVTRLARMSSPCPSPCLPRPPGPPGASTYAETSLGVARGATQLLCLRCFEEPTLHTPLRSRDGGRGAAPALALSNAGNQPL